MNIDSTTKVYLGGVEQVKILKNGVTIWEKLVDNTDYFYIENTYNGINTITLTTTKSGSPVTGTYTTSVEYSKDKSTWTTLSLTAGGTNTISLNQGEKVYFRNDSGYFNYTDDSNNYYTAITGSSSHKLGGNINTLLDYTDLGNVSLKQGCFNRMFVNDTELVDASDLELPSTTLAPHCYRAFLNNCQSLLYAPALPATTLANRCYYAMFYGNSSLISAPTLPATTLATGCYETMFRGCTSITETPVLTATNLAQSCYSNMFRDCSSLNKVTTYANDISASGCITNWLIGVATTGTFNNLGTAIYTHNSASGIPTGWTEYKPISDIFYIENKYNGTNTLTLTTTTAGSPSSGTYTTTVEVSKNKINWTTVTFNTSTPYSISMNTGEKVYFRNDNNKFNFYFNNNNYYTTTITTSNECGVGGDIRSILNYMNSNVGTSQGCFARLFYNCTTLTNTPTLPFTSLADYSYNQMFCGCASLTTAPLLPATTVSRQCYYQMFKGCTSLTTAPTLSATSLQIECYSQMFYGCTSLTTSPALPATTLAESCYESMFQDCTSFTSAPALPATTLARSCYRYMFSGCTSLNTITTYADDISASNCISNWLQNVSQSGTFYNNGSATYPSGVSGIPSGWTVVTQ